MVAITPEISIGGTQRLTIIAGPCAIENRDMVIQTARTLKDVCGRLGINFIFKASYDKANRSSGKAQRGVGMDKGLEILQEVKDSFSLPILTDVHESWQCNTVAQVADILQIPAFLCRQTDLLVAAAQTNRVVNVKKGQFLAPWDMRNVVNKLENVGCQRILLTERGTSFGYNNLVVDMTSLVEMRRLGYPVIFDATHSVQKPAGNGTSTGGNREMIPYLMRAALAVGVDALFMEIHPDPDKAISDGQNQIKLDNAENLLQQALSVHNLAVQNHWIY